VQHLIREEESAVLPTQAADSARPTTLNIVIPVYNEVEAIRNNVLSSVLAAAAKENWQVVAV